MRPLLGMYVHTHWAYGQPYAARTWTLNHWKGYLRGLSGLGYDLIQIWPMLDTMPVPPTPSDEEHLQKLRQVIRFAHNELGMTVYLGIAPNTSPNERAADFTFQSRNYFEAERLIDPSDDEAMEREMTRRRTLLEPLSEADGLWVIDCDPGGWEGSPISDFVGLMGRHREMLDSLRSGIRLIYWMWAGWKDSHQWDADTTGNAQPWWIETLEGLKALNPEPWAVHACWPGHFRSLRQVGIADRIHFLPYNVVEFEPAYPITNWHPLRIESAFEWASEYAFPLGAIANCQTHCLQIPHAYVFAHFALGGTPQALDPKGFGERLIPGHGETLARAWRSMGTDVTGPDEARESANSLRAVLEQEEIATGDLEGLLFGSARRYVQDLSLQLELYANILALKELEGKAGGVRPALRAMVQSLRAWNDRHGFTDRYHCPYWHGRIHPIYEQAFRALGTPEGDRAVEAMNPFAGDRHTFTKRMIAAMEAAVGLAEPRE